MRYCSNISIYIQDSVKIRGRLVQVRSIVMAFDAPRSIGNMLWTIWGGYLSAMLGVVAGYAPATTIAENDYGPTLEL